MKEIRTIAVVPAIMKQDPENFVDEIKRWDLISGVERTEESTEKFVP